MDEGKWDKGGQTPSLPISIIWRTIVSNSLTCLRDNLRVFAVSVPELVPLLHGVL